MKEIIAGIFMLIAFIFVCYYMYKVAVEHSKEVGGINKEYNDIKKLKFMENFKMELLSRLAKIGSVHTESFNNAEYIDVIVLKMGKYELDFNFEGEELESVQIGDKNGLILNNSYDLPN